MCTKTLNLITIVLLIWWIKVIPFFFNLKGKSIILEMEPRNYLYE